jgi:hypothetical protein
VSQAREMLPVRFYQFLYFSCIAARIALRV